MKKLPMIFLFLIKYSDGFLHRTTKTNTNVFLFFALSMEHLLNGGRQECDGHIVN